MRFVQVIIVALSAATFTAGYTIPEGAPNGVYIAYTNSNGEEIHISANDTKALAGLEQTQPNSEVFKTSNTSANKLTRRQGQGSVWNDYYCGCGIKMDSRDTDNAVALFKAQLDNSNRQICSYAWYSIWGSVVAFVCPYFIGSCTNPSSNDFGYFLAQITNRCGRYVPGSLNYGREAGVDVFPEHATLGYMLRWENNGDFCGAALRGRRNGC